MNEQWLRLRGGAGAVSRASAGGVGSAGGGFGTGAETGPASAPKSGSSLSPYEKWKKTREKDLQKKEKALDAIARQIEKFRTEPWAEVGEFLKSSGLQRLPPEWSPYANFEESLSWNIQHCFDRAKAARSKITGALERQSSLTREIESAKDLSEEVFEKFLLRQAERPSTKKPERKIEGRVRKFTLESAGLVAYMGKSAADNMGLLRKAKPFDLWLHLKDYPGAHAVLHRNKEQSVADQDLRSVAAWLVREALPEKQIGLGGRFAVVWVECRHVRAIKGDKLGRVTYHNAREILIAV
jgi:hypothetical protein